MFNGDLKEKAFNRLKKSNDKYQKTAEEVAKNAEMLHFFRINSSKKLIQNVENYINKLSNSPKEFEKNINKLKITFEKFEKVLRALERDDNVATVSGSTAGAGVAAGVGVAAFGPTAAMAIATTFGTASTGTAISALGGAAATNAALAWLGGGAVIAGGGGMVAGNALLTLAGPVGWAIGGSALIGGALFARKKNKDIANKATNEAINIEKSVGALNAAKIEIIKLHELTKKHSDGALKQLNVLQNDAPDDYNKFSNINKTELAALINNIRSLSNLLIKNIN